MQREREKETERQIRRNLVGKKMQNSFSVCERDFFDKRGELLKEDRRASLRVFWRIINNKIEPQGEEELLSAPVIHSLLFSLFFLVSLIPLSTYLVVFSSLSFSLGKVSVKIETPSFSSFFSLFLCSPFSSLVPLKFYLCFLAPFFLPLIFHLLSSV